MIRILRLISFFLFFSLLVTSAALAQTDIYVSGAGRLIPVAVPQLCLLGGGSSADRDIPKLIGRDLDLSGYFEVRNPASYIESPGKCGGPQAIVYSDWTVLNTDYVVKGTVTSTGAGLRVELALVDVYKQEIPLGKVYEGPVSRASEMAHKFANEIMKLLTGEYGPFGTQIAFSTKVGRYKELSVMDMDGSNVRQITNERGLAVGSSWNPLGGGIVYTSYRSRIPDLFLIDPESRGVQQITRDNSLEIGPTFTKDGSSIVVSRTEGSGSNLYQIGLDGRVKRRLTEGGGSINISASFSPDGSQMVFCSDQGGGPQIYVAGADGSGARRISFATSNYCTSPSWSPKGDKLAYVCRSEGGFHVFISGIDGSNAMQLTSYGSNEDPDWSPDGRYLVFGTTFGRGGVPNLALIRIDGSNLRQLTNSRGGDSEPSWGPMPR